MLDECSVACEAVDAGDSRADHRRAGCPERESAAAFRAFVALRRSEAVVARGVGLHFLRFSTYSSLAVDGSNPNGRDLGPRLDSLEELIQSLDPCTVTARDDFPISARASLVHFIPFGERKRC